MIEGLFVDLSLLLAVAAFAWAGYQLGGVASTLRTIGVLIAAGLAILTRDLVGQLVHDLLGKSIEFARLTAMAGVAMMSYGALEKLFGWLLQRRRERLEELEDEYGYAIEDRIMEQLDTGRAGAVAGGVLGYCWALLFVVLLVLTPRDSFYSNAAIRSVTGSVLIQRENALRWIVDGFPHYAQTLPKGKLGAVVGVQDDLPMRGDVEPRDRQKDADALLRSLNAARSDAERSTLVWNPEVAGVARRHAEALAIAKTLQTKSPGGGSIDPQVISALGSDAAAFDDDPAVLLAWAHGPQNAGAALVEDPASVRVLREQRWSEVGIGAVDAGWFNGRIYVVVLVAAQRGGGEERGDGSDNGADDAPASPDGGAAAVVGA